MPDELVTSLLAQWVAERGAGGTSAVSPASQLLVYVVQWRVQVRSIVLFIDDGHGLAGVRHCCAGLYVSLRKSRTHNIFSVFSPGCVQCLHFIISD